jgi:hypothetical protein
MAITTFSSSQKDKTSKKLLEETMREISKQWLAMIDPQEFALAPSIKKWQDSESWSAFIDRACPHEKDGFGSLLLYLVWSNTRKLAKGEKEYVFRVHNASYMVEPSEQLLFPLVKAIQGKQSIKAPPDLVMDSILHIVAAWLLPVIRTPELTMQGLKEADAASKLKDGQLNDSNAFLALMVRLIGNLLPSSSLTSILDLNKIDPKTFETAEVARYFGLDPKKTLQERKRATLCVSDAIWDCGIQLETMMRPDSCCLSALAAMAMGLRNLQENSKLRFDTDMDYRVFATLLSEAFLHRRQQMDTREHEKIHPKKGPKKRLKVSSEQSENDAANPQQKPPQKPNKSADSLVAPTKMTLPSDVHKASSIVDMDKTAPMPVSAPATLTDRSPSEVSANAAITLMMMAQYSKPAEPNSKGLVISDSKTVVRDSKTELSALQLLVGEADAALAATRAAAQTATRPSSVNPLEMVVSNASIVSNTAAKIIAAASLSTSSSLLSVSNSQSLVNESQCTIAATQSQSQVDEAPKVNESGGNPLPVMQPAVVGAPEEKPSDKDEKVVLTQTSAPLATTSAPLTISRPARPLTPLRATTRTLGASPQKSARPPAAAAAASSDLGSADDDWTGIDSIDSPILTPFKPQPAQTDLVSLIQQPLKPLPSVTNKSDDDLKKVEDDHGHVLRKDQDMPHFDTATAEMLHPLGFGLPHGFETALNQTMHGASPAPASASSASPFRYNPSMFAGSVCQPMQSPTPSYLQFFGPRAQVYGGVQQRDPRADAAQKLINRVPLGSVVMQPRVRVMNTK